MTRDGWRERPCGLWLYKNNLGLVAQGATTVYAKATFTNRDPIVLTTKGADERHVIKAMKWVEYQYSRVSV